MSNRIGVFISSTNRDLKQCRERVERTILKTGLYPITMENFNPNGSNAMQLCYDKVREADIFIGIYAHRYGIAPASNVSYNDVDGKVHFGDGVTSLTHWEYLWAKERGLPMLLFLMGETDIDQNLLANSVAASEDESIKSRLKDFKTSLEQDFVVGFFNSPDHLATQVATSLTDVVIAIQKRKLLSIKHNNLQMEGKIQRKKQRRSELLEILKLYDLQREALEKDLALSALDEQRKVILGLRLSGVQKEIIQIEEKIIEIEIEIGEQPNE